MHLWAIHVHVESELLTYALDVLETFLVVGACTTDPDLDVVLVEDGSDLTQSADDTFECGGNLCNVSRHSSKKEYSCKTYVGEVGNTTADEENLAFRVDRGPKHEIKDSASVVEGLSLTGRTGVFTVVGELAGESSGGDSIGVHDGSTTTSNESPHAAGGIENGKLEGSTSLSIHLGDICLFLAHLTTERSGELHWWAGVDGDLGVLRGKLRQAESSCAASDSPLHTALELGGLVELSSKIQEVDFSGGGIGVGDDNERVDFEVARRVMSNWWL